MTTPTLPTDTADSARLVLLAPHALAACSARSPAERRALLDVLASLERLLSAPAAAGDADAVVALAAALAMPPARLLESPATGSALESAAAREYDRYFAVAHVESAASAAVMVRSLLTAVEAFLQIDASTDALDAAHVRTQRHGFACYARLLAHTIAGAGDTA